MPIFHIQDGQKAGETITVQLSHIIMGRSPHSTLRLADTLIDLAHASLEQRGDRWILQDLGAPGGTWLNDEIVNKPRRIFNGDMIRLNAIHIEVQGVGHPRDSQPIPRIQPTPVVQPAIPHPQARQPNGHRSRRQAIGLGVMIGVCLLIIVGFLFRLWPAAWVSTQNTPPHLSLLASPSQTMLAPNDTLAFTVEVHDQRDLERIEFWVNDHLQEVSHPDHIDGHQIRKTYQWHSIRTGNYVLRVIAYDSAGQSSETAQIEVIVQE